MIWPLTHGLFATVYPLANYLGILLLFNFSFNCDVFVVFRYHGYAGITEQSERFPPALFNGTVTREYGCYFNLTKFTETYFTSQHMAIPPW